MILVLRHETQFIVVYMHGEVIEEIIEVKDRCQAEQVGFGLALQHRLVSETIVSNPFWYRDMVYSDDGIALVALLEEPISRPH